ncbi:HAD-IC family P-type ATPase [bacterium]|nr:HAD-IC family P-type ATPase [bacterium]
MKADVTSNGQIHEVDAADAFHLLHTSPEGLDAKQVEWRLQEVGPNRLVRPPRWRLTQRIVKNFANFFALLLDVAAICCFVADAVQPGGGMGLLGWALLGVSVLNSLFALAQELRAERAMEALKKYLPALAVVRREGQTESIPAEDLVPGDLIQISEGDRVSADARLVESVDLLINNAPLTGESRTQPMTTARARGRLIESPNVVFAGCSVVRGHGLAIVFATGHRTEFGKIAALSRDVTRPLSPLERETQRMIRILTILAIAMGGLFFTYGVVVGRPLWVNIVFMLGIIVANVPEGLLPTFTLALSMAAVRMAKRQVLVKSLEAVEGLGAVHVVCTDKTGTLTRNELKLVALLSPFDGSNLSGSSAEHFLKCGLIASELNPTLTDTAQEDSSPPRWSGDPIDVALANEYEKCFGTCDTIIAHTRRHYPFDLQKRRESGVFANDSETLFAVKGAWESIRPQTCFFCGASGDSQPATASLLDGCDLLVQRESSQGRRVIAVASRSLPGLPDSNTREELLEASLTLLGLLVFDDPIRPEVPEAVAQCHSAGIRVILITGDHPDTAAAVARQCGILPDKASAQDVVIVGSELEHLREHRLVERLQQGVAVFARTTPDQKLKIVSALKSCQLVVAMTGDGVNDAPALKAADVGIAMGTSGTDVARESADIVLLDDNFASIVTGIHEGRAIFANMQKFTTYVLASNIPEIVPFLIFVVLPVPLALTVLQILSIDLGTDLLPAIGLGQEPPEDSAMRQPPRKATERLMSATVMVTAYLFLGMIQAAWSLLLFFLVLYHGGWYWGQDLAETSTLYRSATGITLASVILMQIGNVIGRRSEQSSGMDWGLLGNRIVLLGIFVEALLSWAILYWPPVQLILGTGPVEPEFYLLAWLGVPILFFADLTRKVILQRYTRHLPQAA